MEPIEILALGMILVGPCHRRLMLAVLVVVVSKFSKLISVLNINGFPSKKNCWFNTLPTLTYLIYTNVFVPILLGLLIF